MDHEQDPIQYIMELTSCTRETALSLLEMNGYNTQAAVSSFFENATTAAAAVDVDDVRPPIPQAAPERLMGSDTHTGASRGGFGWGRSGFGGDMGGLSRVDANGFRIVDDPFLDALHETEDLFRHPQTKTTRTDDVDDGESASGGKIVKKMRKLADLFRLPIELIFSGSLVEAQQHAVAQGKWLIASVIQREDFTSQTLNRDIWNKDHISAVVSSFFVLWLQYSDSIDGKKFQQFYQLPENETPCITIIDPLSGELLRKWSFNQPSTPEITGFGDCLARFIEDNPAPVHVNVHVSSSDSVIGSKSESKDKEEKEEGVFFLDSESEGEPESGSGVVDLLKMSEEEQIKRALAASLETNGQSESEEEGDSQSTSSSSDIGDGDSTLGMAGDASIQIRIPPSFSLHAQEQSPSTSKPSSTTTDSTSHTNTNVNTNILKGEFPKECTVGDIVKFVKRRIRIVSTGKSKSKEKERISLYMPFPRKKLNAEETIEEAGLYPRSMVICEVDITDD